MGTWGSFGATSAGRDTDRWRIRRAYQRTEADLAGTYPGVGVLVQRPEGRRSGLAGFWSPVWRRRCGLYSARYNWLRGPLRSLGESLKWLRDFPEGARHDAGYQLDKVQRGDQPDDFKPMPAIGKGVEEIRVSDSSGAYRGIYLARRAEAAYVLHAFHKKAQATPRNDLDIAKGRFRQLL